LDAEGLVSGPILEEFLLAMLVAPLIFEAALHVNWRDLKKDLLPILLLAAPGVLIASFIVGWIVHRSTGTVFVLAVTFGALISATDPVAVIAFFRSLGVNKRLALLVEGESLLNDGIAVVIFVIALGLVRAPEAGFDLAQAAVIFVQEAGGGILVGLALGGLTSLILVRIDDYLIETTLTMTLAFGAYLAAATLHTSGILAVVAAGIYVGSYGLKNISPTTRIALDNFWEFLSFFANSIVFLLIGLRIELPELLENALPILYAILAILLSRSLVVYFMSWLSGKLGNFIPVNFRHILFWGGLRGAVSLALALSLEGIPGAGPIQAMTFGVVLFTLVAQGLSIEGLIKRLGLSEISKNTEEQRQIAHLFVSRAEKEGLSRLHQNGLVADIMYRALAESADKNVNQILKQHPELEQKLLIQIRREMLLSGRATLAEIFRSNMISEEVYEEELRRLDHRIQAWETIESSFDRNEINGKQA
jgi:CPA1 family monovalent cation:H+ antiporter